MASIRVKGHEIEPVIVRDSFSRRAVQFQNNIINSLKRLGLTADDVDIKLEPNGMKKAAASVSWYFDYHHLNFSHNSRSKYVENLYVVFKVIDTEVTALIEGRLEMQDFINGFAEDVDVAKQREEARITLGVGENVNDFEVIDKAYKDLAKQHHPDTGNGDIVKFKEINKAHKLLKRELM